MIANVFRLIIFAGGIWAAVVVALSILGIRFFSFLWETELICFSGAQI